MAKVAKTKNSGTYKNLVGATNYYNAVLQNLQNLQIPVNKINNMQYVLNAVNIATYNTNPAAPILIAAWVYVALQIYFIPIHIIFINNLLLAKGVFFLAKNRQKKITCNFAGY